MQLSRLHNHVLSTFTFLLVVTAGNLVTAQKFKIDNDHTSVVFAVSHFGLSFIYGRFNQCGGSFELESGEPTAAGFKFKVATESIDTNHEERDKHLRGPDFFDVEKFPEISFETIKIQKTEEGHQVVGEFKMLDKSKIITMPIRVIAVRKGPFGKLRAGCFTKFMIRRSDFGMDNMLGPIGDNVSITFSFEGIVEGDNDEPGDNNAVDLSLEPPVEVNVTDDK